MRFACRALAVRAFREKAFVGTLQRELGQLSGTYQAAMAAVHARVEAALVAGGLDSATAAGLKDAASSGVGALLGSLVDAVKAQTQEKQRDLSRGITPLVKDKMVPAYERGNAEAGSGSHRRRCAVIEAHVAGHAAAMFDAAVAPAVASLEGLRGGIKQQLEAALVSQAVANLTLHYAVAWWARNDCCLKCDVLKTGTPTYKSNA